VLAEEKTMKQRVAIVLAGMLLTLFAAVSHAGQSKIIIGIIPEIDLISQMERYAPLCKYLGEQTGMEVGTKPLANYGLIYEEMRDGKIDAGFFGSFVYVMTRARIGIEPLARPETPDGASTYSGLTFVRSDSSIRTPADMKGKTIALADPVTTGSYLAQREYLSRHGIDMEKDLKIIWAGSHDAAINAVMFKQADIGGAKNLQVARYRKQNAMLNARLRVLDETPRNQVPDNALAVRKELDAKVRTKLRNALLKMDKDKEGRAVLARFGASRFIATNDADYRSLYRMVKHLNIDLATYPYKRR
jgi:phosphonate transport system substrate-binding protein